MRSDRSTTGVLRESAVGPRAARAVIVLSLLLIGATAGFGVAQSPLTEHTRKLDGSVGGKGALGDVAWLAGRWVGEGFGGTLEDDGRIERTYSVKYRTPGDTSAEELGGPERRYREVYTIRGDELAATLEWWRDGKWQPFGPGQYVLVRRP